MITDDQLYASFKNACGTTQYYHNIILDVLLAEVRKYGPYTYSAVEFK